ncbi:MAG: hypothetical protein ABIK28_23485 [Planctomycetota bacterium]
MKMIRIFKVITAAGLCMLGLWQACAEAEVIRLKNGRELHCEIISSSEDNGITVRRLDNGGVFDLRWEHLLETDAKKIKYACGFSNEDAQPVLIRAKRIFLRNGTYEDGLQDESEQPGCICLYRNGKKFHFKLNQIKDIKNIQIEAKEIYTLEELFQQRIKEGMPETCSGYFDLGVYCESVTYYAKALEMYTMAGELDSSYKSDVMRRKIRLMEAKIEEADATAFLDDVRRLLFRSKFNMALQRIDEFEKNFPNSVQKEDRDQLRTQALDKRRLFYKQKILTDYFTYMDRAANKIASERDIPLDAALDFAADEMGVAIRTKLAEDVYKLPVDMVAELWEERTGGSTRTSSYGTGTFILGADRAKQLPENETQAKKEEESEAESTTLDDRLKKRIEEINKKKKTSRQNQKSRLKLEDIGLSQDQWWATESVANRKRFIISYYVEESGDMRIQRVQLNPCRNCSGRGYMEQISTTGEGDQKIPCEICKSLGIERTVFFR